MVKGAIHYCGIWGEIANCVRVAALLIIGLLNCIVHDSKDSRAAEVTPSSHIVLVKASPFADNRTFSSDKDFSTTTHRHRTRTTNTFNYNHGADRMA